LPATPARGGTPTAPAGAPAALGGFSGGGRFLDILRRGSPAAARHLEVGRAVLIGLRTATALYTNCGKGVYDDTMVVRHKNKARAESATFRFNTELSTQYLRGRYAAPDAKRDGTPNLGQIDSIQTIHYQMSTFLNHQALKNSTGRHGASSSRIQP